MSRRNKKIVEQVIEEEEDYDLADVNDIEDLVDEVYEDAYVKPKLVRQDGVYKTKVKSIGTRADVWSGLAQRTKGGLGKDDLMMIGNRIVSKRASLAAKKLNNLKRN